MAFSPAYGEVENIVSFELLRHRICFAENVRFWMAEAREQGSDRLQIIGRRISGDYG